MSFSFHRPPARASQPPRLVLAVTTDLNYDQRMQRICGSLAAAGYRVQLVGWQRPASLPLGSQPYQQHRLRGFFQHGKLFYIEYNLRLLLYLLSRRAELWGCADLDAALPTWLRAHLGGQPFAYDAHELFTDVPEVAARPAVRRVWQWVENFIVPRAQLRYTVGPALAQLFEARHPGCPFAVVRNAPVGEEPGGVAAGPAPAREAAGQGQQEKVTDVSAPIPDGWSRIPDVSAVITDIEKPIPDRENLVPDASALGSDQEVSVPEFCELIPEFCYSIPDKSALIPDGNAPIPDVWPARPGESSTAPPVAGGWPPAATLLYQGALNVGRGLEALLEAMPQVPARLVVCGEGDLSAALRAQAARLGLLASGQVDFRGFVRPAELRTLTAQATVGIMLLENVGLSYYYSLANKFFDYVQAGIPQLCIDFPEYRALCRQHLVAELVPDLAPATLVAALRRLLPGGQPGAHYQQLAAACQQARREWTWQHEEQVLLGLYEEALSTNIEKTNVMPSMLRTKQRTEASRVGW